MKPFIYGSVLVVVMLLSLPATSDAFSRRSSSSEVAPLQNVTTPVNSTNNVSAQAVPEPPVVMLMSIGLGVFGLGYAMMKFRKQF